LINSIVTRDVKYVHWVMRKCIMVKVGVKGNTHKGGKFVKVGGNNNFRETGGNVLKQEKIGEIRK